MKVIFYEFYDYNLYRGRIMVTDSYMKQFFSERPLLVNIVINLHSFDREAAGNFPFTFIHKTSVHPFFSITRLGEMDFDKIK